MFCSYCGKQISDSSRFCSFCGKEVVKVQTSAPVAASAPLEKESVLNEPVSAFIDEQTVQQSTVENVENTVDENARSASAVENVVSDFAQSNDNVQQAQAVENTVNDNAQLVSAVENAVADFAQSNDNIQRAQVVENTVNSYVQVQQTTGFTPQNNAFVPTQPAEQKNQPERKYTLTHLLMCLASTAVFAIAAGIFAGLYFSGL